MIQSTNSLSLFNITVSLLQQREQEQTLDDLVDSFQKLDIYITPDYQALNSTLLKVSKIAPLIQELGLQNLLTAKDLFQICNFSERVRLCKPFTPTYLKKDRSQLCFSLIIDTSATYILLKGKSLQNTFYPERKIGGVKRATLALQLPTNPNIPVSKVCQLVSKDGLSQEQSVKVVEEFRVQGHCAKAGISPDVAGIFNYTKEKKDGRYFDKIAAFVEAFDDDLRVFDPTQILLADGGDPRPFTLTHEQICIIGEKIAEHIAKLHAENRYHGDIALENVGICFNRTAKEIHKIFLTDFGFSFTFEPDKKLHDRGVYGRVQFSAPEFFRNDKVFNYAACDVYAFGILLSMLVIDVTQDVDAFSEPIWVDDLIEIVISAKDLGQPTFFNADGTPTVAIQEVLKLQEAYKTYSESCKDAIQNSPNDEAFLKALIGLMLHPEPSQRLTSPQVVAYFKAFSSGRKA